MLRFLNDGRVEFRELRLFVAHAASVNCCGCVEMRVPLRITENEIDSHVFASILPAALRQGTREH